MTLENVMAVAREMAENKLGTYFILKLVKTVTATADISVNEWDFPDA